MSSARNLRYYSHRGLGSYTNIVKRISATFPTTIRPDNYKFIFLVFSRTQIVIDFSRVFILIREILVVEYLCYFLVAVGLGTLGAHENALLGHWGLWGMHHSYYYRI